MSKFTHFEKVLHVKTGKEYHIRELPSSLRLEATDEPAYSYTDGNGTVWVRSQKEMEDGRFELVRSDNEST